MRKPYLCMISFFSVGVFCLGPAVQSLMAYPLGDTKGISLKYAVFGLYTAAIDFAEEGNYDQAIANFNKALEINPRYAEADDNRGIAYATGKGQYDRAISDFTRALEINPWNAAVYENRGFAYENLGDLEKACSDWKRACQLGSCAAYEAAHRKCRRSKREPC